jgi:hypothetical protein
MSTRLRRSLGTALSLIVKWVICMALAVAASYLVAVLFEPPADAQFVIGLVFGVIGGLSALLWWSE